MTLYICLASEYLIEHEVCGCSVVLRDPPKADGLPSTRIDPRLGLAAGSDIGGSILSNGRPRIPSVAFRFEMHSISSLFRFYELRVIP